MLSAGPRITNAPKVRVKILLGVSTYILLFHWAYREMVAPVWGYIGFLYEPPSLLGAIVGWATSLMPVFWMPLALKRPSQAIYWLLYTTVYIPSQLVLYYLHLQPDSELLPISAYLLIGYASISVAFRIPIPAPLQSELTPPEFWGFFGLFYLSMTAVFLYMFGSSLRLVSFADRYELRFASRLVETNQLAEYSRSWLAYCLNPILLAVGWIKRRPLLYLMGSAGEILMYSSAAARAWLSDILYIPILYFALKGTESGKKSFGWRMIVFTCCMFILIIAMHMAEAPFEQDLTESFITRIHANPGAFTGQYAKFFSENPLTYGSQISGVNLFIRYPYALPIEYVMGEFIMGSSEASANANLWASGIASFGAPGVLIFSVVLGLVFYTLDYACQHHDPTKAAIVIGIHFLSLGNAALNTAFVGGGIAFSIVMMALMPRSLLSGTAPALTLHRTRMSFSRETLPVEQHLPE
jgi:hypothetical protein